MWRVGEEKQSTQDERAMCIVLHITRAATSSFSLNVRASE